MAYVDLDGDRKPRFEPTLVSDLSHDVIEDLSKYFNPRLMGKDYRSLAGKMGLTHREVKNLDRSENPTEELLNIWMCETDTGRTVSDLMELFEKIKRHDAIKLLKDHEFQVVKNRPVSAGSGSSMVKEPIENGVDLEYDTDEETNNSICSFDGFGSRTSSCSARSRTNTGDNLMSERFHQPPSHGAGCGISSTLSYIDSKSSNFGRSRTNTGEYSSYDRSSIPSQHGACAASSSNSYNLSYDRSTSLPSHHGGCAASPNSSSYYSCYNRSPQHGSPHGGCTPNNPNSSYKDYDRSSPSHHGAHGACTPSSTNSSFNDIDDEKLRMKLSNACENDDSLTACHPCYVFREAARDGRSLQGPVATSEKKDTSIQTELRHSLISHANGYHPPHPASLDKSNIATTTTASEMPKSSSAYSQTQAQTDTGVQTAFSTQASDPIIATDKIALLIGNQNYKNLEETLKSPRKDVSDFAVALKELGFKVISLVDLTLTEMRTTMLAYCQLLGPGVFAVFYYAGHGFEENGENYLMPVDATPDKREEEFIRAQEFLTEMQLAQTALNLVIIDACRVKGINVGNLRPGGLTRSDFGNTIIAYSCQSQMPAFEAVHQSNGVYMHELLTRIKQDMRIELILMEVNQAVHGNPLVVQRPVFESDSIGDCRLTTHISEEALVAHWAKRFASWYQATTAPECQVFPREEEQLLIKLSYHPQFCNELIIEVSIQNNNEDCMELLEVLLQNGSGLEVHIIGGERYVEPASNWKQVQSFRIGDLQKVASPLLLVLQMQVKIKEVHNIELKLNADYPLISSLMNEFRVWITKDKRAATGSLKNTWV